jgi:hypothetical protein
MLRGLIVLAVFPPGLATAELSPTEILTRAFENERRLQSVRSQYFCRERAEHRQASREQAPGKLNFTQSYEWVYLEGEPFRRLVAVNDVPLRGKKAAEENRRMQMTGAERRAAAKAKKPNPRLISVGNVSYEDLLRAMQHTLEKVEPVDGRNAWVIRSAPKRDLQGGTCGELQAECYQFTFWIDQEEFAMLRERYEVIGKGTDALPGTWSTTTYVRAAEGLWFRSRMEGYFVTGPPRPAGRWWQVHVFSDYRKFDAASTITFDGPTP